MYFYWEATIYCCIFLRRPRATRVVPATAITPATELASPVLGRTLFSRLGAGVWVASEPAPVVPASDATQTPAPRREKSVLPNTGDASSVAGIVAAAGTTLVALGLRKKLQ